jgi:hypothetical protein
VADHGRPQVAGRRRRSSVDTADDGPGPSRDRLARHASGAARSDPDLLLDALIFWEPLAPLPVVTAEPGSGADVDVGELLRAVARRLLAHPCHPDDHPTQIIVADLQCLLGLAWYSLLDPDGARAGRHRWSSTSTASLDCASSRPTPPSTLRSLTCAANAAGSTSRRHRSPAPGRALPSLATGAGPGAQRTVWAPEP